MCRIPVSANEMKQVAERAKARGVSQERTDQIVVAFDKCRDRKKGKAWPQV